jgi:hypothetical protein
VIDTATMQIAFASAPGPFNPAGKIKDAVSAVQEQLQSEMVKRLVQPQAENVD